MEEKKFSQPRKALIVLFSLMASKFLFVTTTLTFSTGFYQISIPNLTPSMCIYPLFIIFVLLLPFRFRGTLFLCFASFTCFILDIALAAFTQNYTPQSVRLISLNAASSFSRIGGLKIIVGISIVCMLITVPGPFLVFFVITLLGSFRSILKIFNDLSKNYTEKSPLST